MATLKAPSAFIIGRGREAAAFEPAPQHVPYNDGIIRISSNENARGPAEVRGVRSENIIIGTGSGTILAGATRAFCSPSKPLVTAAPTYGTPETTANRIGAGVRSIHVHSSLGLDLDAMALAARGAGMVFLCNPNNPTGTAHPAADVEAFVRRVKRDSPETAILIDEAYLDYSHDLSVRSGIPLALELPGVFVTRSMSKAHGMAGLRIGYAMGQREAVGAISGAWELGSMNTLSAAAAAASLRDAAHIADEKRENARVRDYTSRRSGTWGSRRRTATATSFWSI